jgi:dolichyl-phosphate-mannose--protein O-mannosyl transferase
MPRARQGWSRLDTATLLVVLLGAGLLRFVALGRPDGLVFDEIFYARDACWYVIGTPEACGIEGLASRSHPPLGKWLVGWGIAVFGYHPAAWRYPVAVAGTVTVGLVYVLAWLLLRRTARGAALTLGAFAAAGLLAVDFLHLVHSRVAMLDAFIALFVVGAVVAIVLDRDRQRAVADAPWWWHLTLGRPWRLLSGMFLGAAAATKWSGAYVAAAIVLLVVAWEVAEERRQRPDADWGGWILGAARRELLPSAVLLGLAPLVVYVASYTGRMPGEFLAAPWDPASVWNGIWRHQRAMLDFHTTLGGDHPYQSPPWAWPLLQRPVAYWFSDADGRYREIMALGNPVVWWPGLLATAALVITWARASWGLWRPEPVVLAAVVGTYLPWLVLSGDRSQTFLWYLLPTVPFVCVALGIWAAWAWERLSGRIAGGVYALIVLASFAFYAPVLFGLPLEPGDWRARILFADCERPDGTVQAVPDDTTSSGAPPRGWCWI